MIDAGILTPVDYQESVDYLSGLLRLGVKLGNDRFEELLGRLGSPHLKLRAIHVGGTKGKGSTVTFISSILRAAGYRVGSYLSPYVYNLRERIQVDGELIPEEDFARIVTRIKPHVDAIAETELGAVTEFELKTAVGFLYFEECGVDYAVVEVGLGGRLDATNVLPSPLVSVITNVGMDHVELLGNTLALIATEKAGIIKRGGVCLTGIEDDDTYGVVRAIADERGARLTRVEELRQWWTEADRSLTIHLPGLELRSLKLRLRGRFQHANAALAVAALHASRIKLSASHYRAGVEAASLPGRFEVIREKNPTIVVDVAHNELAGRVLRDALVEETAGNERPVVVVVGVSRNHDPGEILLPLLRAEGKRSINIVALIATEPGFRPRDVQDVAIAARSLGLGPVSIEATVQQATYKALQIASRLNDPIVVVTGSFYTVGELSQSVWAELLSCVPTSRPARRRQNSGS